MVQVELHGGCKRAPSQVFPQRVVEQHTPQRGHERVEVARHDEAIFAIHDVIDLRAVLHVGACQHGHAMGKAVVDREAGRARVRGGSRNLNNRDEWFFRATAA